MLLKLATGCSIRLGYLQYYLLNYGFPDLARPLMSVRLPPVFD